MQGQGGRGGLSPGGHQHQFHATRLRLGKLSLELGAHRGPGPSSGRAVGTQRLVVASCEHGTWKMKPQVI